MHDPIARAIEIMPKVVDGSKRRYYSNYSVPLQVSRGLRDLVNH